MITAADPAWSEIKKWLLEQIGKLHEALEDEGLTAEQTAAMRGEIRAYRAMISAAEPVPIGGAGAGYS